ncbi:hypothetical protein [Okeania sp.]|uniref:hypothetical protein n=1 Tax=Okeania sp. TaxID=3100323 RepID=UPI002B4AE228|nr:hypothetical protein [Okeania sp.]MEB3343249.1 hypothetical protein [Okeania sp.]
MVSLWEIAIKINRGKLEINQPIEDLSKELQYMNISILPIIEKDIELYAGLPFPSNHRDTYSNNVLGAGLCKS